jgi:hypothetical protein
MTEEQRYLYLTVNVPASVRVPVDGDIDAAIEAARDILAVVEGLPLEAGIELHAPSEVGGSIRVVAANGDEEHEEVLS